MRPLASCQSFRDRDRHLMKSRMRPPLKLTEDEPPASAELSPPIFDRDDQDSSDRKSVV